ncbi:MAG: PsiF family protein [Brachymonas sp.]|nr:PsiF family protein [Brachymonas sp.]
MRKLFVLGALALSMSGAYAFNSQQQLMKTCNVQAKTSNKTGADRKAFMKSCLADGRKAQQEKMKTCNIEAAGKKGAERKAFMSTCLKK